MGRLGTDTAIVTGFGGLVKIAGAVKVLAMARVFGTSNELDAFLIAFLVPSLVAETLAGPLGVALVPGFVAVRRTQGGEAAEQMHQSVALRMVALLAAASAGIGLISSVLVPMLASGFREEKLELTRELLLWLLPILPMTGFSAAWRARLNADGRFALASVAPMAVPLTSIAAILGWGQVWGIYALAWGALAGAVLEDAVLAAGLRRYGCAVLPRGWRATTVVGQVLRQYLPAMGAGVLVGLATLVDQAIATRLAPGSVSAFSYGTRLVTVLLSVAATGVTAAVIPLLSQVAASGDWNSLKRIVRLYSGWIAAVTLPLTVALILGSEGLVQFLFQGGEFGRQATQLVAAVQRASLLRLPFGILLALLAGVLAALRANELLLPLAAVALLLNASLDLVLMAQLGVTGIALAGSATPALCAAVLLFLVRHLIRQRERLRGGMS